MLDKLKFFIVGNIQKDPSWLLNRTMDIIMIVLTIVMIVGWSSMEPVPYETAADSVYFVFVVMYIIYRRTI